MSYDPEKVCDRLHKGLQDGSLKPEDATGEVKEVKLYVDKHKSEISLMKEVGKGLDKLLEENEALEEEVAKMRSRAKNMVEGARDDAEILELAQSLRAPISRQCEKIRLHRQDDIPPPFDNLKSIQEITRSREQEILVATKQLRELKMISSMMRQHEKELETESAHQIAEKSAEKDADILHTAVRFMREREQILEDVKSLRSDIDAIEAHLKAGHYENKEKKAERLKDYREKMKREYGEMGSGTKNLSFETPSSPTEDESGSPASPSSAGVKYEAVITKQSVNEHTGMHFEDKTRLAAVVGNSPADRCGLSRYIGARVTHVNGVEVKAGHHLKLAHQTHITLRFDMDGDSMRCSTLKNEEDDPIVQFKKKESKFKDPYKGMETDTARKKAEFQREKQELENQQKRLREYQQKIAAEKAEKEREIKKLAQKLAAGRNKEQEYEMESKKLYQWMEESEKKLEGLRGKVRRTERAIRGTAQKSITGGPAQAPSPSPPARDEDASPPNEQDAAGDDQPPSDVPQE